MTEHELKEMKNLGAELGAAKAELERLSHKLERARDHLTHARHDVEIRANAGNDAARLVLKGIDQWLSDYDQSPTDTYTAVEMATAAAQGFRDGQAAVEQAAAQDELRKRFDEIEFEVAQGKHTAASVFTQMRTAAMYIRPAQTEQMNLKPLLSAGADLSNIAYNLAQRPGVTLDSIVCEALSSARKSWDSARAALNFQQGKFRMGDLVKKSTGSEWQGRICGTYSTTLTPEGYAVESEAHAGSVQIYPAKALEAVE